MTNIDEYSNKIYHLKQIADGQQGLYYRTNGLYIDPENMESLSQRWL